MGIKLIMRQTADFAQFLFLPRLVQHFLPCLDLIIRHLRTDLHPLFVQLYDLLIRGFCVKMIAVLKRSSGTIYAAAYAGQQACAVYSR